MQRTHPGALAYVKRGAFLSAVLLSTFLHASCGGESSGDSATSATASIEGRAQALAVPPGWTGRPPKYEVINGITVPPEPAPTLNNSTLTGVDINNNGVRDDVERKIATDFGGNQTIYTSALIHARAQQTLVVSGRQPYLNQICNSPYKFDKKFDGITKIQFNNPAREQVYYDLARQPVTISADGGCQ